MKCIQKGWVRYISIQLQEEEHKRKHDYVSKVSIIKQNGIDPDTKEILKALDFGNLGLRVTWLIPSMGGFQGPGGTLYIQ